MARKDPSRRIGTLLALSLPAEAKALASLPHPRTSTLDRLSAKRLEEATKHFQDLWLRLALDVQWRPRDSGLRTRTTENGGTGGFWSVLRTVGSYYAHCLYRYASVAGPDAALAFLEEPRFETPLGAVLGGSRKADIQRLQAMLMLVTCNSCASKLFLAASIDEMGFQPGELAEGRDADLTAIEALEGFQGLSKALEGELLTLADELLALAMEFRRVTVRERSERRRQALRNPAALVSVRELTLLSSRHHFMAEKYGEKQIERTFEQQVGVIFQTLGFIVVPARPGQAVADLLCISREDHFCFLVDAKTSGKPYKLPKADRRAMADYVRGFVTLPDLGPLEFVLVVGWRAAATVPEKMKQLEIETRVPVRFIGAALIAMLQQSVAGPVLSQRFKEAVIGSSPILDETIVNESKEATDGIASIYTSFFQDLKAIVG